MKKLHTLLSATLLASLLTAVCPAHAAKDWRDIRNGWVIPDEGYCDQPYVVVTRDGHWVCIMTTSDTHEGAHTQHIVATRSANQGRTWSRLIPIEPPGPPEASWAVPLITPNGRIYVFYTYNDTGLRDRRTDTMGSWMFKYSDDGGLTWSAKRYRIPMRVTRVDRQNQWGGKIQMFWGIDKPNISGNRVYFAFTKLGKYMLDKGEGWLFTSDNLLTESDPTRIHWQMLPDGDNGIRSPALGSIQEEHNLVPLGGQNLFDMFRTTNGFPANSYSRDGGHSWSLPVPAPYRPGGRVFKTPRACPMVWRTHDGRFLFWFHNQVGRSYHGRNPVWICGGKVRNGFLYWSQPEILLYRKDNGRGMSYPDLIEQGGHYWVTETQKTVARVHRIDTSLLEGLWSQGQVRQLTRRGLVCNLDLRKAPHVQTSMPALPDLANNGGFTLDFWVRFDRTVSGQIIASATNSQGNGLWVRTTSQRSVELVLQGPRGTVRWDCDPGGVRTDHPHHFSVIVDGGPYIISWVLDGRLCDGGSTRPQGWYRFYSEPAAGGRGVRSARAPTSALANARAALRAAAGQELHLAPALDGQLVVFRIYNRYLRTSEAIANFNAGM